MPIDFAKELNPAQLEAVERTEGPVLVIAGAGSGKTRTIVYRLAHLAEMGIPPENILLLTFTRKAAQEMLFRAEEVLGRPLTGTSGGTFHSFSYSILRRNAKALGYESGFTLMDRADSETAAKECKDELGLGKGDKSYPKKATLMDLISKSRNKELSVGQLIEAEAFHLTPYADDVEAIAGEYSRYKRAHGLMDYDDLLFELERLLTEDQTLRSVLRERYQYVMVDEYQDTNLVQARLVRLIAGKSGNVMAVGDDAQSIYAFRGANVENILKFPKIFEGTHLVRLEQNYRSTQPILDLTNHILDGAEHKFDKTLFTERTWGEKPRIIHPLSDQTQANLVLERVIQLAKTKPLHEIAVLFRAGYHSYGLEVALKRLGIEYQKYGGLRFHEAAHVKDVLAWLRLVGNPADMLAWMRVLDPIRGIGAKTAGKIVRSLLAGDEKYMAKARKKFPALETLLADLDGLRGGNHTPAALVQKVVALYTPTLMEKYPDDYPKRQAGLEQLAQISVNYGDLESLLADLTLDGDQEEQKRREDRVVLSTVHSAKGLEWDAVMVIDLVEDRFPSRKALQKAEDLEEERRLLYVACTRARESLSLFVPSTIYNRFNGSSEPTIPSPFVRELPADCAEVLKESYANGLKPREPAVVKDASAPDSAKGPAPDPGKLGRCKHRIFGPGKIVSEVGPNKYRVNFPGFGLKVIVGDYLEFL